MRAAGRVQVPPACDLTLGRKAARVGSTLTCTASVLSGGSRACSVEADVVDDDQRLVARSSSTYLLTEVTSVEPAGAQAG